MKKLFIYYSHTGNGDLVASILKQKGFEIIEIEPKKDIPTNRFLSILMGGYLAMRHKRMPVKEIPQIDTKCDIYVGTPIWNGNISCPINTIIDNLKECEFSLICYSASGKIPKVHEQLKDYKVKKIISLKEPTMYEKECKRILEDQLN